MAEAKRVPEEQPERSEFSIDMEGFDQFFAEGPGEQTGATGTAYGDSHMRGQVERLVDRITELMSVSVDQRVETSKIASQLIHRIDQAHYQYRRAHAGPSGGAAGGRESAAARRSN